MKCSTPGGVLVGFTDLSAIFAVCEAMCSTPGGVLVGFTLTRSGALPSLVGAQRPGASWSGSHHLDDPLWSGDLVLNARGRLGRVHSTPPTPRASPRGCAQRPGASWSGSRRQNRMESHAHQCSTNPGASWSGSRRRPVIQSKRVQGAQRPGASWSGSRWGRRRGRVHDQVLNARGRLGRVHTISSPIRISSYRLVLNARGRLGRVHEGERCDRHSLIEGAQRPGASWSGSPYVTIILDATGHECSTPGGVLVGFTSVIISGTRYFSRCSTPGGVLVGFTSSHSPGL